MSDRPDTHREEKSEYQLTRELELLISAGLIFALLQLPGLLDNWWNARYIHVGGSAFFTIFTIYYVGKLLSYALVAVIVTHFLLRGLWVALLGLRSAFPGGVDHERLHFGPMLRGFYQQRLLPLEVLEDRIDRVAASLFSFVFLFVIGFGVLSLWAAVSWGIALLVSAISGRETLLSPVFAVVLGTLIFLQLAVAAVDRLTKKRQVPERVQSLTLRVMSFLHYASLNAVYAPLFLTFSSRLSRRFIGVAQVVFVYLMVGIFIFSVFTSRGILSYDSYTYFPFEANRFRVRAQHYDNLRPTGDRVTVPTIQSDVVADPYVRLFVPYDAREDNKRMARLCPDVRPLRSEGFSMLSDEEPSDARVLQLMKCLGRVYQIHLDGRPLPATEPQLYVHPGGGVAGRLFMIPATALQPGRHLLTVRHTPIPYLEKDEREDKDADEYSIPFWR